VGINELDKGIARTARLFAYVDELPAGLMEQFVARKLDRGYLVQRRGA